MVLRASVYALVASLVACGSSSTPAGESVDASASGAPDASAADGGVAGTDGGDDAADADDAAPGATSEGGDASSDGGGDAGAGYDGATVEAGVLTACKTTGTLGFAVDGTACFNFTPAQAGLPSSGANATSAQYAIRPGLASAAPTQLVLFFIGSGAEPVDVLRTGSVSHNVYGAAVSDGDAVLGLAYDNEASIASDCGSDDSCYFPTRQSVILGTDEPGSMVHASVDEGILDRTATSLRYLTASDPMGGWGAFLTTLDPAAPPASAIAWGRIIVSGHSQGGGHAAALAKLFPVLRVVQLSSTCDEVNGVAASWTAGTVGTWASDPTQFRGFAAPRPTTMGGTGDSTCAFHTVDWASFGMAVAYQDDMAAICGATGDTHSASLICADNYPTWISLYK